MYHTHPKVNVNVMTDFLLGDMMLSVILSLSWTTAQPQETYTCHGQNFLASPKKQIFCICHVFAGSPEHRETVDTFSVAQHCPDNTEGGISQRTENRYFLLVQTLGTLPSLSDSYTLSSQEHTEYWVKRQTWGYAYVKKLSLGNISSSKHWRVQSVSSG